MTKEDYVSYKVAKLLKEKGFDGDCGYCECHMFYHEMTDRIMPIMEIGMIPDYDTVYFAPTQQMAMKWLREVHGLHISLESCYDYDSMHVEFLAFVQNVADVHEFMDGRKNVASHYNAEKSCEAAIKYCLENLI